MRKLLEPARQSQPTVNLSVFRRHPCGASALSSACKSVPSHALNSVLAPHRLRGLSSAGTKARPPSAISTAGSGIGRSGDGGQVGTAEEEADDGTSEANSLGCASQQDSPERSPTWPGRSVQSRLPRPRRRRQQSPSERKRPRAASRQVVNGPLCKEPLIVALASGRSDCHHRGRVDACSRRGSFPAP
jgi:hypothetical protein